MAMVFVQKEVEMRGQRLALVGCIYVLGGDGVGGGKMEE